MNGYGGSLLRVDLTRGEVTKEALDPALARDYLGGRGFAARILYGALERGVDPWGPDNILVVAAGPLSGLLIPGAGKTTFAAKSPATGGYADSNMGGHFSADMKYAGYDLFLFQGCSPRPVYLLVDDGEAELRPAEQYWGQGALTAEKALKEELSEGFQIATIGPAGERGVRYACISHDFGRQAGRAGVGAVMGAKGLKAMAVRGTGSIPVADLIEYRRLSRRMYEACKASQIWEVWTRLGTSGVNLWSNEVGTFPTRNFQTGAFEGADGLGGELMRQKIVVTDKACFGCSSPCGKYSYSQKYQIYVEGPEYETAALLGANVALSDIEEVAYANYLCDQYGLDTISAGNVVAFAMECFEKGVITAEETEGLELRFGHPQAVFALLEKIAKREGIGEVLAQGVKYAAQMWGKGSEDYAIQVKGLEMSGYESRNAPAMLLSYMTADVGAHHNRSWAVTYDLQVGRDEISEAKVARVIELQHIRPLFDCLGACRLQWVELGLDLDYYAQILKAVTGLDRSWGDLLKISERVWNLTRAFWAREVPGFGREWDYPPPRTWKEPVSSGPTKGKFVSRQDVERLLDLYYAQRGWDQEGIPTPEKLEELGLTGLVSI